MFKRHCRIVSLALLILSQSTFALGITVEFSEGTEGKFTEEAKVSIREIAEKTEAEVRQFLPDLPEDILLSVSAGSNVIPELGIGASSPRLGHIEFVVDTNHPQSTESIVRTNLRSTLFHEMHHLTRGFVISGGEPITSFMDAVVGEGMATVFEREFAGSDPLWGKYPDDVHIWVEELIELPMSAFNSYGEWMFQHPDGRRWIGYRAGTYIVDQVQSDSGLSSADLVKVPTQEILDLLNQ